MLHGNMLVNGDPVGFWSARRTTPLNEGPDAEYTYEVKFQMLTIHNVEQSIAGTLVHRYSDGAPALIAKIMEWASEEVSV